MAEPTSSLTPAQMAHVLDVSRLLAVTVDLDPLMRKVAETTTSLLGCERASIFLHDAERDELWTKIALQSEPIRVPADRGIVGRTFRTNQIIRVPQPYEDPNFNREPDQRSGFRTRSILAAPMVDWDRRPTGVLQAINKLAGEFTDNDQTMIQLLADQAGVAVQRFRLHEAAAQSLALQREMELAKKVQQALIPIEPPAVDGLDVVGWTRAASATGGDCFDLWQLPDGRLGVLVADASGHGLAPAIVVSQVRTLVRAICELEPDPDRLLERVNNRVVDDLEAGRFVTAFLAFIDGGNGNVDWSSAGHGLVHVARAAGEPLQRFGAPKPPLGLLSEVPELDRPLMALQAGGTLVVMSDGVVEARSPAGEFFNLQRVQQVLAENLSGSASHLLSTLRSAVIEWEQGGEPSDDQTIVVVKHTPWLP